MPNSTADTANDIGATMQNVTSTPSDQFLSTPTINRDIAAIETNKNKVAITSLLYL